MLKTGAAYLPLDLNHPAERVELMLTDAAPHLVIAEDGFGDRLVRPGDTGPRTGRGRRFTRTTRRT